MSFILTNHRLNRCKTVQVKLADVALSSRKAGQTNLHDSGKLSMTKVQVNLLGGGSPLKRFSSVFHSLGRADVEVRVVTKAEITKLRKMGYEVKVVKKLASYSTALCVDGFTPTVKSAGPRGFGGAGSGVYGGTGGFWRTDNVPQSLRRN